MGLYKCCVGGCTATSETHTLYSFPKNDNLRNMWMSFLVPTNSLLIGLSKEQLLRKRVCGKHFDKSQFDEDGKRLRYSYPCLFTEDEIVHAEPRPLAGTVQTGLSDHNYYKEKTDEDDDVADTLLVIGRAGDNFHEHPSCSYSQAVLSVTDGKTDAVSEQHSCSTSTSLFGGFCGCAAISPMSSCTGRVENQRCRMIVMKSKPVLVEKPVQKKKKCLTKSQQDSVMQKLDSKKKKSIKHVKRNETESLDQTAMQRQEKGALYGSNEELFKNVNYLNKQAQTLLLMQLRLCRQNKMARRFTLEEKRMALELMKQSPKSYELLENMLALPNKRTLERLAENTK